MISSFLAHLRARWLRYTFAWLALFGLVVLSLTVRENYPFSHFPMYGKPSPGDVDYYFLTDAQGTPLSTYDYAGISAPQIKKRINQLIDQARARLKVKKDKDLPEGTLDEAALTVLQKMRTDGANPRIQPPLMPWPAGVQLKQGLIETTPEGFRETFRTVATLPDAGPDTKGVARPAPQEADGMQNTLDYLYEFLRFYGLLLAALLLLLFGWKRFPATWQTWLGKGAGFHSIGRMEGFLLRAALAFTYYQAITEAWVIYDQLPHPQGLAHWEMFRSAMLWCGDPEHWQSYLRWSIPLLVWYVLGWANLVPLTILTVMHILQRTLYGSQGAPHHGFQIISLVFLAQMLIVWVRSVARVCRSRWAWVQPGQETTAWLAMAIVIGAIYVITAVSKWTESKGQWLENSHYFSNQIVKTYRQNFYNDLNPAFQQGVPTVAMTTSDPANDRYRYPVPAQAQWLLLHPHFSRAFFSLGFLMEFTAFLLILHRGLAALYGLGIIAFHLLVIWLMKLPFPQNMEIVLILCLNLPGWLIWWRFRKTSPSDPSATIAPAQA